MRQSCAVIEISGGNCQGGFIHQGSDLVVVDWDNIGAGSKRPKLPPGLRYKGKRVILDPKATDAEVDQWLLW
jgi:hypothetical protein